MHNMYNINKQLRGRAHSNELSIECAGIAEKQVDFVFVVAVVVVVQLCASRTAYLAATTSHAGRIQYERYVEHFTLKQ